PRNVGAKAPTPKSYHAMVFPRTQCSTSVKVARLPVRASHGWRFASKKAQLRYARRTGLPNFFAFCCVVFSRRGCHGLSPEFGRFSGRTDHAGRTVLVPKLETGIQSMAGAVDVLAVDSSGHWVGKDLGLCAAATSVKRPECAERRQHRI